MSMIIGLVVCVIVMVAYYLYTKFSAGDAAASVAASVPPPPLVTAAPMMPVHETSVNTAGLGPLYSSGQKIQDAELEIGYVSVPFASAPFGYTLTAPPVYSMTMDIMVSQTSDRWRNIMEHGPATGNDFPPGATFRRPSVFITGNDTAPANRLMITHANASGENTNVTTSMPIPLGKYFTLSWVVYNGTMTVYINGVADSGGPVNATFNWPQVDTPWTWNQGHYLGNIAGSVKVKNVYWFNRSLASSDLALVAAAYGTTVSHYEPEPFVPE
jgi:hypothetical protein